jgi:hypothetical protein
MNESAADVLAGLWLDSRAVAPVDASGPVLVVEVAAVVGNAVNVVRANATTRICSESLVLIGSFLSG